MNTKVHKMLEFYDFLTFKNDDTNENWYQPLVLKLK